MTEQTTVLYGPNLVPTERWLAETLFQNASVASLTPEGYPIPRGLEEMAALGWWKSAHVTEVVTQADDLSKLAEEAVDVAQKAPWTQRRSLTRGDRMLLGKLPAVVENELHRLGFLERTLDRSRWTARDPFLIPTIIHLAGSRVAERKGWRLDFRFKESAEEVAKSFDGGSDGARGLALTIERLPSLGSGVPLSRVIQFRVEHDDLFDHYLQFLRDAEDEAATLDSVDRRASLDRLDEAAEDIRQAAALAKLDVKDRARILLVSHGGLSKVAFATGLTALQIADNVANLGGGTARIALAGTLGGVAWQGLTLRKRWRGTAYIKKAAKAGLLE